MPQGRKLLFPRNFGMCYMSKNNVDTGFTFKTLTTQQIGPLAFLHKLNIRNSPVCLLLAVS